MAVHPVVVEGVIKSDGTLEVIDKVALPAGRVQVTVVPLPEVPADDPFWQRMQAIWDRQQASGHVPRSVEEVEAERQATRDEWEERLRGLEQIQSEGRAARPSKERGG
ncbi:MAG: hypothetical protein HYS12_06360 [Planctomycetes bacterium]|nr:hypothetical protein [Planctomycetota bacterium]